MAAILNNLLLTSLSDISEASLKTPYDAVVAGGGTAGIVTARTLVESGRRVALLELGPLTLLTHLSSTGLRFDADLARAVQTALQFSLSLRWNTVRRAHQGRWRQGNVLEWRKPEVSGGRLQRLAV